MTWVTFASICEAQYIEKKSRFIAAGCPIQDEAAAEEFIDAQKKLHKEARHHVYALRRGATERYSDDGEPSGTAGLPVLTLLRKENIENAVVVVTRYFGGVLLGTGGLTRAYGHSAKLLLTESNIIQKARCQKFSICVGYSVSNQIRYLVRNSDVLLLDIGYGEMVTFFLLALTETLGAFLPKISEIACGSETVTLLEEIDHAYPF